MEKLLQVSILRFAIALLCCQVAGISQVHCPLTVRVISPDRDEIEATINVREANGHEMESENKKGGAQFCGVGILPLTVTVGRANSCNQVTVRNVPVEWQKPYTLWVTYDPYPCLADKSTSSRPACQLVIRVTDRDGNWIPAATVDLAAPLSRTLTADDFGRVYLAPPIGAEVHGRTRASGYASSDLVVNCSEKRLEKIIALDPKTASP